MLDDWLIEILVCPDDKGPLWYLPAENLLYNPRLRRRYAIRDDIPNLLVDEAEAADDADHDRLAALAETGAGVRVTGGGTTAGGTTAAGKVPRSGAAESHSAAGPPA